MERGIYEIVDTESLVPAEHVLRKIDAAVDWNRLYDMVEALYCADNGRARSSPRRKQSTGLFHSIVRFPHGQDKEKIPDADASGIFFMVTRTGID